MLYVHVQWLNYIDAAENKESLEPEDILAANDLRAQVAVQVNPNMELLL